MASTGLLNDVHRFVDYDPTPRGFSYGYKANSSLVQTVTGVSSSYLRTTTWRQERDLVDSVATTWSGNSRATYSYAHDNAGRRTDETFTGGLQNVLGFGGAVNIHWTYDERHQVKTETFSDNGVTDHPRGRGYDWDQAGNRSTLRHSTAPTPPTTTYTPNSYNQFASATGVEGTSFAYDDDGNLTSDGVWSYGYDAENRLISMSTSGQSLSFAYDYMGRRVRKTVTGTGAKDIKFAYDGWSMIAELDASTVNVDPIRTYTWGLDASGTKGGAGVCVRSGAS